MEVQVHEFLGSKRLETLRQENSVRASSSSSSRSPPETIQFVTGLVILHQEVTVELAVE
jgi:hypothetical protein